MQIEQAIFTSRRTSSAEGYHLVARGAGIHDDIARELTVWSPTHDSLYEETLTAGSLNFFPLSGGEYCLARTTAAGGEYSGRSGQEIYTQCLIFSTELLERFANNPFAIERATVAAGNWQVLDQIPPSPLPSIKLLGRAKAFDAKSLPELGTAATQQAVVGLLDAILTAEPVGVVYQGSLERLLAMAVACLPTFYRTHISFTTGLQLSPRRPFQVNCLPTDEAARRNLLRHRPLHVYDPRVTTQDSARHAWAAAVERALQNNQVRILGDFLNELRANTAAQASLDELATTLDNRLLAAGPAHRTRIDHAPALVATTEPQPTKLERGDRIAQLTARLQRSLTGADLWRQCRQLHAECLEHKDWEHASELVLRVCRVFGAHSPPLQNMADRVGDLLERQREASLECLRRTARRLKNLRSFEARGSWIELAEMVIEQRWVPGLPLRDQRGRFLDDYHGQEWAKQKQQEPVRSGSPEQRGTNNPPDDATAAPADQHSQLRGRVTTMEIDPSVILAEHRPEIIAKLEQLDDMVFEAIAGKASAMEELRTVWPDVLTELGPELLEESKEQYIRHALSMWQHCIEGDQIRQPAQAVRVVEVINLLLDGQCKLPLTAGNEIAAIRELATLSDAGGGQS